MVTMEARDPQQNVYRSYRIEAGTDLFGEWIVEVTYGRIGAPGRLLRYLVTNEDEAKRLVQTSLRRRASAPQRIGTPYRICQLFDLNRWVSPVVS